MRSRMSFMMRLWHTARQIHYRTVRPAFAQTKPGVVFPACGADSLLYVADLIDVYRGEFLIFLIFYLSFIYSYHITMTQSKSVILIQINLCDANFSQYAISNVCSTLSCPLIRAATVHVPFVFFGMPK